MSYLIHGIIYFCAFYSIWFGANLIVESITKFSRKLRISNFSASFFILGLMTSIPEFALGLTSITSNDPEIFVGNLIGGIIVIFLLIIPLLAILGNGIRLKHQLSQTSMLAILFVCITPSLLISDRRITHVEALVLIGIYTILFFLMQSHRGFLRFGKHLIKAKAYSLKDLLTVLLGVIIVFVSSQFILNQTLFFSQVINVSPIIISVIVLSVGTNLPELSIAIKSVISGKKDIAFGNYLGSAATNTLLFGFLSLINEGEVVTTSRFSVNLIFLITGIVAFYLFSRSKNTISRKEGFILFSIYLGFISYWILNQYINM